MSEWRPIPTACRHCGKKMEARPTSAGWTIKGLEAMEYRHAETGKTECYTQHEARPYTEWGQYKLWQKEATDE